jgi:hypothetical protein
VRLVGKDGDIIWSTTQESGGGKFRSAMADVADKIMKQLTEETRKMRDLAALAREAAAMKANRDDLKATAAGADVRNTPDAAK